jgi:hypothetical protein
MRCKKCKDTQDNYRRIPEYFATGSFSIETNQYEALCSSCLIEELLNPTEENKDLRKEFFSDVIRLLEKFR